MTTLNIAELCRVCVNPSNYHANVFQTRSLEGNRLFKTLNAICQLNIVEGDDLPKYLCMQCKCKVSEIEVFKQKSQKGRRILLSLTQKKPSSEEDGKLKECNTTDVGGRTRSSGGEDIEIDEHPAVLKIEQVEEPNEVEYLGEYGVEEGSFKMEIESPKKFIATVSSVPYYLTVSGEINTEAAWHNQEHRVVDVQTVKGSWGMQNLEGCEMPLIQKEYNDKANKETVDNSAIIAKSSKSLTDTSKSELRHLFCNTCKKGFLNKFHLGNHVRIHNGVRPYKCSICSKSFSLKCDLLTHNSVHTVIRKPHVCTECGKSFNHKHCLRVHIKLHRSLYPFQCITCGKVFKSAITYNKHLKIHDMVTPFSCNICKKYFSNKSSLVQHQKTQSKQK